MKRYLILFTCIIFSCSSNAIKQNKIEQSEVTGVEIKYVEFIVNTPFSIKCELFDSYFEGGITTKKYDKEVADSLVYFLERTKSENKPAKSINTRYKIVISKDRFDKNDTITVCGDLFNVRIDGELFKINEDFRDYLLELTSQQELLKIIQKQSQPAD